MIDRRHAIDAEFSAAPVDSVPTVRTSATPEAGLQPRASRIAAVVSAMWGHNGGRFLLLALMIYLPSIALLVAVDGPAVLVSAEMHGWTAMLAATLASVIWMPE